MGIYCVPFRQGNLKIQDVQQNDVLVTLISDISRLLMDAATCDQLSKVFQHFKCFQYLELIFLLKVETFPKTIMCVPHLKAFNE